MQKEIAIHILQMIRNTNWLIEHLLGNYCLQFISQRLRSYCSLKYLNISDKLYLLDRDIKKVWNHLKLWYRVVYICSWFPNDSVWSSQLLVESFYRASTVFGHKWLSKKAMANHRQYIMLLCNGGFASHGWAPALSCRSLWQS